MYRARPYQPHPVMTTVYNVRPRAPQPIFVRAQPQPTQRVPVQIPQTKKPNNTRFCIVLGIGIFILIILLIVLLVVLLPEPQSTTSKKF